MKNLHGAVSGASAQPAGSLHRSACLLDRRAGRRSAVLAMWPCMLGQPAYRRRMAQAGDPWRLLFSRGYRAELLVASCVAFFSQINGARAMASSSSAPEL